MRTPAFLLAIPLVVAGSRVAAWPLCADAAAKRPITPDVADGSLPALVERLRPAVVNIQAIGPDARADQGGRSLGSGFVIHADGYVVTGAHVVAGAQKVRVILADERSFPARVIGADEASDVALLKLDARGLPTVTLGDSDAVRVGDAVIAIGNPFGLGSTVTTGIVSAKDRSVGDAPFANFLQTDASINPGSSGGPIFNARGEVVGISTALIANGQGIGFAIPINTARVVFCQLRERGHVVRGWLGIGIQDVTPALAELFSASPGEGALVSHVEAGGPASAAGIRVGDVIVEYDGRKIPDSGRLLRFVAETPPGRKTTIRLLREGRALETHATIGRLAGEAPPARPTPARPHPRTTLGVKAIPRAADDDTHGGEAGVVVTEVAPGSPAGGLLLPGDLLLEIDRRPIQRPDEVDERFRAHPGGKPLLLRVRRGKTTVFVPVDLR